jgi:arylsulfate sulfotransferase
LFTRHPVVAVWSGLLGCALAACGGGGARTAAPAAPISAAHVAPSGLAYPTIPASCTVGVAIDPSFPRYDGDTATSFTVSPPLPPGLSLDPVTGVIAGTPTAVAPAAPHTVRASNAGGHATTTVTVAVLDAAPEHLAYAATTAVYTRGVAIPPNVPTHGGGAVAAYAVTPALPRGLVLDDARGVIRGTPTEVAPMASYLVRASSASGSTTTSLSITVNEAAPAGLAYATSPAVYTVGVAIPANRPTSSGGVPSSYQVTPALPAGLELDPATGIVTGTPEVIAGTATFEVRASNEAGSTATSLSITVNDVAPSNLAYTTGNPIYAAFVPIAPNQPTSSGGVVTSYQVAPELPAGLVLDVSTGVIRGTPQGLTPATVHLVTASNSGGSTSALLTLTVTTRAVASQAVVAGDVPSLTPFTRYVLVSGSGFDGLQSVTFRIAAKTGTVSRPVSVTYDAPYLLRRNYLVSDQVLRLPIFGLYAGTRNAVDLELAFADGSLRTLSTQLTAEAYDDADGIYTAPSIVTARHAGDGLGFDYFWIKSGLGSPVLMDSDGNVRWVEPGQMNATSSVLDGDGFYVGAAGMDLLRLELDGSMSSVTVGEVRYRNFHHDMARGKEGLLAMVDGTSRSGVFRAEAILVELDTSGDVLKEWDFAEIIGKTLFDGGDEPTDFVRDGSDWFHINSAVYLPEDDSLLVSSRENFVMKIDHATGDIRWVFGDPGKYWYSFPSLRAKALTLTEGLYPIGQHSVSSPASGELLLFNNGEPSLSNPRGTPAGEDRSFSEGSRYVVDEELGTARQIGSFDAERQLKCPYAGSIYEAGPGSYLISYAAVGRTAELVGLLPDGSVGFELDFPARATETSWNAQPLALDHLVFTE